MCFRLKVRLLLCLNPAMEANYAFLYFKKFTSIIWARNIKKIRLKSREKHTSYAWQMAN